jgi:hypothetical protein
MRQFNFILPRGVLNKFLLQLSLTSLDWKFQRILFKKSLNEKADSDP